jgi:hypothetical protein
MTGDDFDQAAVDLDLYRRAAARCTTAEPHRDADEAWPCSGCLLAAARQLAIASNLSAPASTVTGGSAATGAVDGVAGLVLGPPSGRAGGSTPNSNRPLALNEGPAECGPARPQKQV